MEKWLVARGGLEGNDEDDEDDDEEEGVLER